MSIVSSVVSTFLPPKRKTTPSGWTSFNAPCCIYNGHAADTRSRGGLIINAEQGVSYHCFNCGFKCSWQSGRNLSLKFKKFLQWLGVPDNIIQQLALDLLKQIDNNKVYKTSIEIPVFKDIELPKESTCINDFKSAPTKSIPVLEYLYKRNLNLNDTDFYWTPKTGYSSRLIIPFYYNCKIVGYTARTVTDAKPKYLTQSQPGYIFNLDKQYDTNNFIILCEGPIDALHINGVSVLGSELSNSQILLLQSLKKEIIVIPDRDKAGKKLINQAIDLNWCVSFPPWENKINDVSEAVDKYGRLLTLYSIIKSKEESSLKIKLGVKKWIK
jgi:hypothetical protein